NEIGKKANEKNCLNYRNNYKKPNSLESQNGIVKKDSENCESPNYKEVNKESNIDIRMYITNKFYEMEKRLRKRNEMEANTNQKLDTILSKLETQLN
ncbi:hypothetical protein X777_15191, partial [Ooceraea biroi]